MAVAMAVKALGGFSELDTYCHSTNRTLDMLTLVVGLMGLVATHQADKVAADVLGRNPATIQGGKRIPMQAVDPEVAVMYVLERSVTTLHGGKINAVQLAEFHPVVAITHPQAEATAMGMAMVMIDCILMVILTVQGNTTYGLDVM